MKKVIGTFLASFFLFLAIGTLSVQAEERVPATLDITIQDGDGALVHHAHVYIFSRNKKEFYGTLDAYGTVSYDLPPGDYRVYAAENANTRGVIDHYSSPEAFVHLIAGEPMSVILCLHKAADSELYLTKTAQQKLGIDKELAKYLN
jgi:hypothetical protein